MSAAQLMIIGGAVVGLILLAALGILLCYCLRRSNRKAASTVALNGNALLKKNYEYQSGVNGDKGLITFNSTSAAMMNGVGYQQGHHLNAGLKRQTTVSNSSHQQVAA